MVRAHLGARDRRWWHAGGAVVLGLISGFVAAAGMSGWAASPNDALQAEPDGGSERTTGVESVVPRVSAPAVEPHSAMPGPSSSFDDSRYSLDDPESIWVVVNKHRPLDPVDFAPDDLVQPANVTFSDGGTLRRAASDALGEMKVAAEADGVTFRASSAYRGFARQQALYSDYVAKVGGGEADTFSARPGYSEHQTGWSVDLYDTETCRLHVCFADSDSGKWIAEHGPDFGFIIRYPKGESEVTGYQYEPWHVRYVGEDLATEMRDSGVKTLEEFFGLAAAPEYVTP